MANKLYQRYFIVISFFLITTNSVFSAGLDSGAWPTLMQNSKRTGLSEYEGIKFRMLKWKYDLEQYINYSTSSSPAIGSDGTIYVGSADFYIYALNPGGSLKWRYQTEDIVSSSPTIGSDGTIYVGSNDFYLYALNPDGTLKWRYQTNAPVISSPIISSDGTIYVGSAPNFYAINVNGTLKWLYQGGSNKDSAIGFDGTIFISAGGDLKALNPDGTLKWQSETEHNIYSSPTIGSDGTIYVCAFLKVTDYVNRYLLYALSSNGSVKWQHVFSYESALPSAIGTDGTIYVSSDDLYAINADGSLKWKYDLYNDSVKSSPIIDSNGTIYIYHNGRIEAINSNGSLEWYFAEDSYIIKNLSPPAIGPDSTVYWRSSWGALYALGMPHEKGLIYGKITDLSNGDIITYATISVTSQNVYSDTEGIYYFIETPGLYTINCSKTGYQTFSISDVHIITGEQNEFDIELTPLGPLNIVTTTLSSAETTVEYNDRVRISGGIYPYTYSTPYGALPPGLSIDSSNGTITGIPTSSGTYTFAVGVEDSEGSYAEGEFSIEVTEKLDITTSSPFFRGTRGTVYSNTIDAANGTLPYSFSKISGTLPPGISLLSNGSLTGTPSNSGSYDFTVRVTDASSRTDEASFHIEIVEPLVISTSRLNDGITGVDYTHNLSASGGYGTCTWSVFSGTLPTGVFLDSATGTLSGTPANATSTPLVISVTDQEDRITYRGLSLQLSDPLEILTATLPTGLKDTLYSEAIRIHGGIGPFTYGYSGLLPDGLYLNTSTGIVSGTPTAAGLKNVSITVTDSTWPIHQTSSQNLGIRVTSFLVITTSAILPKVKKAVVMNPIILGAGGGPSPYTWSFKSGYMPDGITLNPATGELSGTPADGGDFVFTLQVTDSAANTAEKEFFLHVSAPLTIVTGAIPDGSKDIPYNTTLEAKGGLLPYSWRVKSGTLPTGLSLNGLGTLSGTPATRQIYSFTVEVSDSNSPALTAEKTYSIDILDVLYVYTKFIPNGRINQAYQATITASLGAPPYSWRLESGVLPPGITLTDSPAAASLEGTPTSTGTYTFTLEASDNGTPVSYATREYTMDVYDDVVIQTLGLASAVRGAPYSDTLQVTGGKLDYHYSLVEGSLPAGLTLNSSSGRISGTADPVYGHSQEFTVRVQDSGNPSGFADKQFTIYVTDSLAIAASSIQAAFQKYSYLADLEPEGGISPYTWSVLHGDLPEGLTLDGSTGEIAGAPVECGIFYFTIRLDDASAESEIATRSYSLTVVCSNDYDIAGTITDGSDVTVILSGDASSSTTTLANGRYLFQHLTNGSYTITPGKDYFQFNPQSIDITVTGQDKGGVDFTAIAMDTDSDGVLDYIEAGNCTILNDADSDDDGIPDGIEDADQDGLVDAGETDPCDPDTDGDGIQDGTESGYALSDIGSDTDLEVFQPDLDPLSETDPLDADTDDDGITDGAEDANRNGILETGETDPGNLDTDRDGIQDGTESGLTLADIGSDTDPDIFQPDLDPSTHTNPLNKDSDGDRVNDGKEDKNFNGMVDENESDPFDPESYPVRRGMPWLMILLGTE